MPNSLGMPTLRFSSERGFTLVEVLVTMLILTIGISGAIALIDGANARTVVTKEREAATALAREVLEHARSVPYNRLTPTGAANELKALPGLADSTPGTVPWTVRRRNQTYTLAVSVCSIDDDQDEYGDHAGGNFCNPAGTPVGDGNPDDYKRLVVRVDWKRGGTSSVRQAGIINNESATSGPDLEITVPTTDLTITTAGTSSISFEAQTDSDAVSVRWSVDGVVKETDTLSGTSASFDWRIDGGPEGHIPDGTYVVTAIAYDTEGRPGVPRSRTIRLSRDLPEQVEDVFGGWNGRAGLAGAQNIVELQWSRNEEPDIVGYRVYRRSGGGGWGLLPDCDFPSNPQATSCIDLSPPAVANGDVVEYYVVALDEDPSTQALREGAASIVLVATRTTNQPNPPATLTATVEGDSVRLTWPPADPVTTVYTGSNVIFYRVYRDGSSLGHRIARTGQQDLLSYLDDGAATSSHQWYVTAVDETFSESAPVGPVTLP